MRFVWLYGLIFLLLAGCVNNTATSYSSLVKDFSFIPREVYSNEEVYLRMILENNNDFLVKNIYVYVYNLGNDWGIIDIWGEKTYKVNETPWRLDIDASFYYREEFKVGDSNVILDGDVYINNIENILKGSLPEIGIESVDLFIMRKDISIMIEDIDELLSMAYKNNYEKIADLDLGRTYKSASKLPPVYVEYLYPKSENYRQGERVEIYWAVRPPQNLPKGKDIINTANARVCYETTNKISNAIRLVSSDEFLVSGRSKIGRKSIASNNGDVRLILDVADPIIVGKGTKGVNFVVVVENVGKGVVSSQPCKSILNIDERDYYQSNRFVISIEGMRCSIEEEEVFLPPQGKATIPVSCVIETQNVPEQERFIDIKISYTYYQDFETPVVVKGV